MDRQIIDEILSALDSSGWTILSGDVEEIIAEITQDGAFAGLYQLGIVDKDGDLIEGQKFPSGITDLVNEKAVEYAKERSAGMVGMKIVDGELVQNPNASWRIDESTREFLRADITQAMEEGWSNDRLAEALEENYGFSAERAEMIARTETSFADNRGTLISHKESGVVTGKQWIVGAGCCDVCAELDGVIVDLDDPFESEDGAVECPPLHPNCRCSYIAIVKNDEETDMEE